VADAPANGAPPPPPRPEPARSESLPFGAPLGPGWTRDEHGGEHGGPGVAGGPAAAPHAHGDRECLEWCPICRTADVVRASVPPELRGQLEGVQRDALVAMRAMLDHHIDRLDGREDGSSRVEDIPIS
jgi:hypothetical protein